MNALIHRTGVAPAAFALSLSRRAALPNVVPDLLRAATPPSAVEYGAVERIRPKMMTVTAVIAGLLSILWSQGTGADVMKRIAAPMVGGMVSSTVLTLVVIPAVYSLWQEARLRRRRAGPAPEEPRDPVALPGGAAA